jgi:hypothetical protein
LIFCFFLGFYLLTAKGLIEPGDSWVHFRTTRAIVEDRSLVLDCDSDQAWLAVGPNQECYSKYEAGFAASAAPLYLLARTLFGPLADGGQGYTIQHVFTSTFNQLVTAATGVVVYLLALHVAGSKRMALETAVLLGIATLAWPYASPFLTQSLVGLLITVAAYLLITGDLGSYRHTFLAGLALGWACFVRVDTVLLAAVMGAYVVVRAAREHLPRRPLLAHLTLLGLPVAIAIALFILQSQLKTGTLLQLGYDGEGWTTLLWTGLYGLLLSPGKGLIFFSPLSLLAIIGLVLLGRRGWEAEAALIGCLFLVQVLFYGTWAIWHGGWTWEPRFLVSTQALLMIGLVPWLSSRRGLLAVLLLATVAFLVQLIGVTTTTTMYLSNTSYSEAQTWHLPRASQIVGQAADLLALRAHSLVATRAYGVFSKGQTLLWLGFCCLLIFPSGFLLRRAVNE